MIRNRYVTKNMNKNRKYRVLLHAMTFQRDFSFIYVLSKLLEKMGCECIIVNNTNLHKKFFKLWNPDAIFFVTLSHAKSIITSYPNAKLFLWAAEGGYKTTSEELRILEDDFLQKNLSRIYLWGQGTQDAMEEKMKDLNFSEEQFNIIRNKCALAGNPRMDISRFQAETCNENSNKTRIGFIGNFYYINNNAYHPFSILLDSELSEKGSLNKLDIIQFQIRQLKTYCDLMQDLGTEKYSFSLRPYPLENFHNYKTLTHTKKFPFQVDESLDFSSWVMKQDLIIGGTSTTLSQIAVAKKPFINNDKLNKRPVREYDKLMAKGLTKHQPLTYKQLLEMVEHYQNYVFDNVEINETMKYFYNTSNSKSVICEVAKDIYNNLFDCSKKIRLLQTSDVLYLDNLWSLYIEKRSAKELKNNYTYFRRSLITPKADSEFKFVVDKIIEENF